MRLKNNNKLISLICWFVVFVNIVASLSIRCVYDSSLQIRCGPGVNMAQMKLM